MSVLIVSAHPRGDSLNRHLAETLAAQARASGTDVTLLDLYATGFDPVLTAAERGSFYATRYDGAAVAAQMAQLSRAEVLVLVFPTWWFGLPAILKGWIDRVWVPGLAYDHASDLGPIRGRLTGLRQVVVVTTLGAPEWVDWLVMRRPVARVLRWGVVKVCAPQARFRYLALHRVENVSPDRLRRFERRITAALAAALRPAGPGT